AVCQGSSYTYSISAVPGATSYTWTLPSGWSGSPTSTSIEATAGASGGTISVTASNDCGTSAASTLSVSVTSIPAQPGAITGNTPVCEGSSNTYSITAVSGATAYTWTLPSGWSGSSTSTSIEATAGSSGGTISVTADNSCGSSAARTLSVAVTPVPAQPGAITGETTVCQGSLNTYSIAAVSGATSYTWTLPSGWSGSSTSTSIEATAGASGGTISVTANNSCGSGTARTLSVTVATTPAQPGTITGETTVCQGSSNTYSISAVSGATSYTWTLPSGWTGNSTSTSIEATADASGGTISVTASNDCGTSAARTLSVSVTSTPAQPGAITGETTVCQGSSNTYSISAVSGATSYTWTLPSGWTGSSTTNSITANAGSIGGTVSVTANNSCGSSAARTLSVSVTPTPAQPGAITGNTSVCQGSSNTYSIAAVSGATSYTWTLPSGWTGSSTSTSIEATAGASGGTISVTANNSCGSGTARTLSVTVAATPAQPGIITGETTVCQGSSNTYSISAVSGATSYTWTLPSGWSGSSTSTSIEATAGSNGGTISVTASNACGTSTARTQSVSVTLSPAQPGTITGITSVCQGSSNTYSIAAVSGATSYTWSLPSGWTGSSTSTSIEATAGASGGTISVTANNSCGSSTASILNVSVTPIPAQPGAITGSTTVCQGSSNTYSIAAVSGATSYTWTLPSGWTGSSTSTSIEATAGASGGTISVTANNSCGSGTARTLSVTVATTPAQPGTITGETTVCQGSSNTYSIAAVSGATSYTWTLPSGWTGSSTSTSIEAIAGASGGTISVTASNACGTSTARTLSVSVTSVPTQPGTITGETTVCQGSSNTYSITAVSGATSYTWTLPSGWTGSSATTSITAIAGASGGTVSVTANNLCGASTARTLSVSVTPVPAQPGTITGETTVCQGSPNTYSIAAVSGATSYTWILPSGWTGSSTSTLIEATAGASGGTISVAANNDCGSGTARTLNVTVATTPAQPGVITGATPVCQGSSNTYSISAVSGATSYNWTLPSGWTGSSTSTSISATAGSTGGTISVTADNSCGASTTRTLAVTVSAIPTPPAIGTITQPTCAVATGSVVLNDLPSSGTWTLTRSPGSVTSTGTGTSTTISGLSAGTYSFTVTNATGCVSASSANVVINVQPIPTVPVPGTITQPTCEVATGSVVISGLPSSGTWTLTRSPGNVTVTGTGISTTVTGIAAGTYTFTVTNAAGCTSASSEQVVINPQPPTPSAPVTGPITQITCLTPTGNIVLNDLPATGSWTLTTYPGGNTSTGTGTSTTVTGLIAGTYTFTVTNASGCTSPVSDNAVIDENTDSPPAPVLGTITQPTVDMVTGSVELSGLPAAGDWTLTREPGTVTSTGTGTTTVISGLEPGSYNFVVTNASGCISAQSAEVFINAVPAITGQDDISVVEDSSFTLSIDDLFITDADNTPDEMTLTISSGIDYELSEETIIIPSSDFNGTLSIPVTVNDGIASSNLFYVSVSVTPVNDAPFVYEIPDQVIVQDSVFAQIYLDDVIEDDETPDELINWTIEGNAALLITIIDRVVSITVPAEWTGSDTIVFIAQDNDATDPLIATDTVVFTVNKKSGTGMTDREIHGSLIYPNPANDHIYIQFAGHLSTEKEFTVEIYTLQGMKVHNSKTWFEGNRFDLDVHDLCAGHYFIRLITAETVRTYSFTKK
ncbi:MAG: T9SS type A sorting domain-containing protein, partial [Bacteroidales bacterium]|nr:T9SS type A sorting domain-containing protein [Bacteroidales bacterium]